VIALLGRYGTAVGEAFQLRDTRIDEAVRAARVNMATVGTVRVA